MLTISYFVFEIYLLLFESQVYREERQRKKDGERERSPIHRFTLTGHMVRAELTQK